MVSPILHISQARNLRHTPGTHITLLCVLIAHTDVGLHPDLLMWSACVPQIQMLKLHPQGAAIQRWVFKMSGFKGCTFIDRMGVEKK